MNIIIHELYEELYVVSFKKRKKEGNCVLILESRLNTFPREFTKGGEIRLY